MSSYTAQYPRPNHFLLHLSDTHLVSGDDLLYNTVDADGHLRRLFDEFEASGSRPEAIVFTGDLADKGDAAAYAKLRSIVEPVAERLDARLIWVMGNHDDRIALRTALLDEAPSMRPVDTVHDLNGLRIIVLDTSVPGHHYGTLSGEQLDWLRDELSRPAPAGTILAMHHPPIPSVLDLAVAVELRGQDDLAVVLQGSDVRSIIAGHLHYSTNATFAGIPVSVASATCYTQDLNVKHGGTRGRDGAQSFNLVHVYPQTVVHSVVPLGEHPTAGEHYSPERSALLLATDGIRLPGADSAVVAGAGQTATEVRQIKKRQLQLQ